MGLETDLIIRIRKSGVGEGKEVLSRHIEREILGVMTCISSLYFNASSYRVEISGLASRAITSALVP